MPLSAGDKLGPYEILCLIGKGGMGEVYRAHDPRMGRDVAVKVSAERFTERFDREVRAVASLNHPNICQIYDVGPNYLVMEFIDGKAPKGPLPVDEALRIAHQIGDALEAAHEKGIVHRDLKPGNIKIKADGTVKVLDFGLAKLAPAPAGDSENSPTISMAATQAGVILGTAAYMSPEQARGKVVDKRADIWAFGVVFHELLTGRKLFAGEDISDTLAAVIKEEPKWDGIPANVQRLLKSCLEKDPKKRLRDIGDAWGLLDQPPASQAGLARTSGFGLAGWIAAGALAAALAVVLWAPWRAEPDKPFMRLEVDLGADTVLPPFPTGSGIAISPDSTRIVYATASGALPGSQFLGGRGGRGGGRGGLNNGPLFIRRLNEAQAVALSGTEGATNISFSPDSQWIAFSGRGAMSKISVEGGPVVPLAVGLLLGWAEDGSILFRADTGMMRIPAGGGEPVKVPGNAAPRMLPGGKAALITRSGAGRRGTADTVSIEAVSTADGKTKVLVPGGSSPRYLPTGHLIYVSKGRLFAVLFDPDKLETRGTAVPIVNDVQFNSFNGAADLSVSRNGTLVYRKGGPVGSISEAPKRTMEWIDATGKRSPVTAKSGAYLRPLFSPDGGQVALLVTEPGSRDEWVYDLRLDSLRKVTYGEPPAISTPVWSPDSRYLFLGSGDGDTSGIYSVRADGSSQHPERLLKTEAVVFPQSYSKEAKRLAYWGLGTGRDGPSAGIFTVPLAEENGQWKAGTAELFLPPSPFADQTPAFSPDGRWLAYATNESGQSEVNVRPASGPSRKFPGSTDGGSNPRWWRSELLYQSGDRIMSVSYTVNGDTFIPGKPRVRVDKIGSTEWDVAPDGRILVLTPAKAAEATEAPPAEHTVVFLLNFFDELRRRVPLPK